jgi:hypothetical protein
MWMVNLANTKQFLKVVVLIYSLISNMEEFLSLHTSSFIISIVSLLHVSHSARYVTGVVVLIFIFPSYCRRAPFHIFVAYFSSLFCKRPLSVLLLLCFLFCTDLLELSYNLPLFFFFGGTGVWIQGFTLAKSGTLLLL